MATLRCIAIHILVIYCVKSAGYNFLSCLLPSLHPLLLKKGIEYSGGVLPDSLKLPTKPLFCSEAKKTAQLMSILIENHCEVPGAIYNLLLLNGSHYFWFEYCLPVTLNSHLMCDLLSLISVAEIEMEGSERKLWFCEYCPLFNTNPSFWIVWLSAFSWLMSGGGLD